MARLFGRDKGPPPEGGKLSYEVACTPKGWIEYDPKKLWSA